MKKMNQYLLATVCAVGVMAFSSKTMATETAAPACPMMSGSMPACCRMAATAMADTNTNGIPDLLKTCPVSGDKLGGDMGGPYVFSYKGQEVKLCCKNCRKDFDKNPEKYMKLIRAADKKK